MITTQRMREILVAERLILEPVGQSGWTVKTAKGERLVRTPAVTPEDAAEQAEATLAETRTRNETAIAVRAVQELQRGEVYVRPRDEQDAGDPGVRRRVFDLINFDGTPTTIRGKASYVAAVEEHIAIATAITRAIATAITRVVAPSTPPAKEPKP